MNVTWGFQSDAWLLDENGNLGCKAVIAFNEDLLVAEKRSGKMRQLIVVEVMTIKQKNLFIISHNDHSFLHDEILRASEHFDKVFALVPLTLRSVILADKPSNVIPIFFDRDKLKYRVFRNLSFLSERNVRREIHNTFKLKSLTFRYIKELQFYLAFRSLVEEAFEDVYTDEDSWTILSMWYAADAYAAYCIKLKHTSLVIASLAHSYEIDPIKNPHILNLFRSDYHSCFDVVSFISKTVYSAFLQNVASALNLTLENTGVAHLGISAPVFNEDIDDISSEVFTIVTCSHAVEVKRLEKMASCLSRYADLPITWVHFGDGPCLSKARSIVEERSNDLLTIDLRGSCPNAEIKEYYSHHAIDLFVNVSLSEGVPVSIMEAIAFGIPVIATDAGGNSEIVCEPFGSLVPVDVSDENLWLRIREKLILDKRQRKAVRAAARSFFRENYDSAVVRAGFYCRLAQMSEGE